MNGSAHSGLLDLWDDPVRREALLDHLQRRGYGVSKVARLHLALARQVNLSTRLCDEELKAIVAVLEREAGSLGLQVVAVGGTRRGELNAHDLGQSVSLVCQSVGQSLLLLLPT